MKKAKYKMWAEEIAGEFISQGGTAKDAICFIRYFLDVINEQGAWESSLKYIHRNLKKREISHYLEPSGCGVIIQGLSSKEKVLFLSSHALAERLSVIPAMTTEEFWVLDWADGIAYLKEDKLEIRENDLKSLKKFVMKGKEAK